MKKKQFTNNPFRRTGGLLYLETKHNDLFTVQINHQRVRRSDYLATEFKKVSKKRKTATENWIDGVAPEGNIVPKENQRKTRNEVVDPRSADC